MNNNVLNPLFSRLLHHHRNSLCLRTPFPGTIFDLPLELERETLHIMPRLPNETVQLIAKGARTGNVDDMLTISMMYSVGLGVPADSDLALAWSNFSLVQPSFIDFKEAVKRLRKHLKDLPEKGFAYPAILDKIYASLSPKFEMVEPSDVPEGSYVVTPLLAGLRAFFVYRVHEMEDGKHCYLYDVRIGGVHGERLSLGLANKLNVPNYLGAIRGEPTIPDYPERMRESLRGPARYFIVGGTLVVPASKKPLINEALPRVKTVSQLFDHFAQTVDNERMPFVELAEYRNAKIEAASIEEDLKALKSGELYDTLQAKYSKAVAAFKRAKKAKNEERMESLRPEILRMKEDAQKIKSGTLRKELKSRLAELKSALPDLEEKNEENRAVHHAQYPENLFEFVATDIYYGVKGKSQPIPLGRYLDRHLQSLGFTAFTHSFLQTYNALATKKGIGPKVYKSAVATFSEHYPEYNVSGLIVRSAVKTVNTKQKQPPVYIVAPSKG